MREGPRDWYKASQSMTEWKAEGTNSFLLDWRGAEDSPLSMGNPAFGDRCIVDAICKGPQGIPGKRTPLIDLSDAW